MVKAARDYYWDSGGLEWGGVARGDTESMDCCDGGDLAIGYGDGMTTRRCSTSEQSEGNCCFAVER